jgi:hypothetical protein
MFRATSSSFFFLPFLSDEELPSESSRRGSTSLDEPTDSRSLGSRDGDGTCTTAIGDLPADMLHWLDIVLCVNNPTAEGSTVEGVSIHHMNV